MEDIDRSFELSKIALAAFERLTYSILAASGSAIAFALFQTTGQKPALWMVPVAVAILAWGLSFYWGCEHLVAQRGAVMANAARLQGGGEGAESLLAQWTAFNQRSREHAQMQYGAFIVGAGFFVVSHIQRLFS